MQPRGVDRRAGAGPLDLRHLLQCRQRSRSTVNITSCALTAGDIRELCITPDAGATGWLDDLHSAAAHSPNGVTQRGFDRASQIGMTLFGRASNRHFPCYTGFDRFDAEPEPYRMSLREVAN